MGVCKHLKSSTMTAAGETFCRQVRKAKREAERHHAEACLTDFGIPGSRVRGFYLHPGCSTAAAICRHKKCMELCVHDISRHQLNRKYRRGKPFCKTESPSTSAALSSSLDTRNGKGLQRKRSPVWFVEVISAGSSARHGLLAVCPESRSRSRHFSPKGFSRVHCAEL